MCSVQNVTYKGQIILAVDVKTTSCYTAVIFEEVEETCTHAMLTVWFTLFCKICPCIPSVMILLADEGNSSPIHFCPPQVPFGNYIIVCVLFL